MDKCDSCLAKSFFENVFDLHWVGEDDCPLEKCFEDETKNVESDGE